MLYARPETRELLIAPPIDPITKEVIGKWIEVPDDYKFPPLPEPPPEPDLETFNEKQIDTLTKVFVEGNKTQPLRISWLQEAWRNGDFDKAIALWNYLAPSFVEVVTTQEIADFQSDLVSYNIPLTLDSSELTLALK